MAAKDSANVAVIDPSTTAAEHASANFRRPDWPVSTLMAIEFSIAYLSPTAERSISLKLATRPWLR
jgi:hypothetical protein